MSVVFAASEGDTLLEVLECQEEEFVSRHGLKVFPSRTQQGESAQGVLGGVVVLPDSATRQVGRERRRRGADLRNLYGQRRSAGETPMPAYRLRGASKWSPLFSDSIVAVDKAPGFDGLLVLESATTPRMEQPAPD
jgi:hypothetical protein